MTKTLTLRTGAERGEPQLQKKGRGWNIAESRLDTLHENAREMRRNPSEAQTCLGAALTAANLGKYRFRSQAVIGSAIVNFACQPLKLVVEIDEPDGDPVLDRRRDASLEHVGIKVLRFPAADILADAEKVAQDIVAQLKLRWEEQRARPRTASRQNYRR